MIEVVDRLMAAVRSRLVYEKKVTTARTPVGEALRLGRGVCQDFAHLFLAACRGIGLPARYVSGYIHQTGRGRHPRLVPGLGRPERVGGRGPDPRHFPGRRSRQDRHRPRLLRRPAQPRRLEGPGQGDDRRQRQGRGRSTASRPTGASGPRPRPPGRRAPGSSPSARGSACKLGVPAGVPPAAGATAAGARPRRVHAAFTEPDGRSSGPDADVAEGDRTVIGLEEERSSGDFLVVPGVAGGGLERRRPRG